MAHSFAIVGRQGDIGGRWTANQARKMYAAGVVHATRTGEMVQVWQCLTNGDLLNYDGERTRKLSDKIVEYRKALQVQA